MSNYECNHKSIIDALKSPEVAHSARVQYTEWARHHIFNGTGQYIKGKNRGRLPYVSVELLNSDFEQSTFDGQMENFSFVVRVDVNGRDKHELELKAQKIIRAFMIELIKDQEWRGVSVNKTQVVTTPWGGYVDVTLSHDSVDGNYDYLEESD